MASVRHNKFNGSRCYWDSKGQTVSRRSLDIPLARQISSDPIVANSLPRYIGVSSSNRSGPHRKHL